MQSTRLPSAPLWLETPRPSFATHDAPANYDALVIGGGITGLTAAYLLKRAGKTVALFEKARIGGGETGHTTAHLCMMTDTRLPDLARDFGDDAARLAWQAGAAAIETIASLADAENIACRFRRVPGFVHAPLTNPTDTPSQRDDFRREADLARRLGFDARYHDAVPLVDRPGVGYADQGLFDPIPFLIGLARAVHGDGSAIFEHAEIDEVRDQPLSVKVGDRVYRGGKLVVATHVPLVGIKNLASATAFQTKLAGYSTYAVAGTIPKGSAPHASFNDTEDPYHYLRIDSRGDHDVAILGGEDHKTGQHDDPAARYAALEQLLRQLLPDIQLTHRWSGQVIETPDGLPYIGPVASEQFNATGYAGNGMTFGVIAGAMACDWSLGRDNPWQDLFHPDRKPIRAGMWEYLKEQTSYPYHLAKGFLKPTAGDETDDVRPGEGKLLKLHGQRCAVSRTEDGTLTVRSAICTHMGCVVRWNTTEKTWDCPCHGSRFAPDGAVLAGPAETPLAEVNP